MKRIHLYKINGVIIALLILLASIPPIAISEEKGKCFSNPPDNLIEISVEFLGIEGMQRYDLKITEEKYREIQKIFNDTLKSLMKVETNEDAYEIFKETIMKLRDIGIISQTINITKVEEIVTGGYLNPTHQLHLVEMMENLNLTSKFDNILCFICGEATHTFKMDFSNRVYDLLVRIPVYFMNLLLTIFIELFPDNLADLLESFQYLLSGVQVFPLSSPISFVGTIYFGSKWYNPYDPHQWDTRKYPSKGSVWTMGIKGIKTWNGTFFGNSPIDPFFLYFPLLNLLSLLETVAETGSLPLLTDLLTALSLPMMLYVLGFYLLPFWIFYGFPYPGAIGFTGLYIGIPFDGPTFFIGHTLGVAIKEFRPSNETHLTV